MNVLAEISLLQLKECCIHGQLVSTGMERTGCVYVVNECAGTDG